MAIENVVDITEELIQETAETIKSLPVGSEERSREVRNLGELLKQRNESYKNEMNAYDQQERRVQQQKMDDVQNLNEYERRLETKRVNDAELALKAEHNKIDWWRIITDGVLQGVRIGTYMGLTGKAFECNREGWQIPDKRTTQYTDLLLRK